MDCNLPGSPAHGIFQARELECIAILFSRDLPNPGIEAGSPSLQTDALPFEPPGKQEEEYIEELYKKGLNDPDNHNGMVSHLEPDILECEVNWALGSITRDKTTGGDTIPAELFQILTNDAVQVLHSICQQIQKTQQWPQDWKRSVFIPIQRRAMSKNVQTTRQLHSLPMIAKLCSKSFKLGFSST